MPAFCKGSFPSEEPCDKSTVAFGERATISGACTICGERRCRSHCACGRAGTAVGRNAPRVGEGRRAAPPAVPEGIGLPQTIALPVGRPAHLSVEMLDEDSFFQDVMTELRAGEEVFASTFMYDDPRLHDLLLSRLGNIRREFKFELIVDRQATEGGTCRHMRPRLRELKRAGADIWTCDGHNHREIYGAGASTLYGHVHVKAIVVDRRVAYIGSMNLTRSARANREIMFKIRGPPVRPLLEHLLGFRENATQF